MGRPKGYKHTKKTKRKMSKSRTGLHASKETKQKMSEAHKGAKHPRWKGGQHKNPNGRIMILMPEHHSAPKNGYVRRSRLAMEKKLGRYLESEEIVHHINGIVDDDTPENLQLFPNKSAHTKFHSPIR